MGIVTRLDDGSYGFSLNRNEDTASEKSLLEMREVFNELSKLTQAFYQSDLLSSIVLDTDEDGTDTIEFENKDDVADLINAILEGCTIPRWVNELLAATANNSEIDYSALVSKTAELVADSPMVSSCGEFVLIRQEFLEYIMLYGYRKPILEDLDIPSDSQLTKSSIVVLLYLFLAADEEGYLRKNDEIDGLMQLKDISIGCGLSISTISKAVGWWKSINVIEKIASEGIHGYRFSNKLIFSVAGMKRNYLTYRKNV